MSELNGTTNGTEAGSTNRLPKPKKAKKPKVFGKEAFYTVARTVCETKATTMSTPDKELSVTLKSLPEVDEESLKDTAEDGIAFKWKRAETINGKTVTHTGKAMGSGGRELMEAFIAIGDTNDDGDE